MEGARGNHDPYQAFLPWGPNRTISSPKMAAAAPPKTYHMVSWVNLPVNVLLSWSAAECDAFLPTISSITQTTSRTIPKTRCMFMTNSNRGKGFF
jgi:hypothetical protein